MVLRRQATRNLPLLAVAVQHQKCLEDRDRIFDVSSSLSLKEHRVVDDQSYLTVTCFSFEFPSRTHFWLLLDSRSDFVDFASEHSPG